MSNPEEASLGAKVIADTGKPALITAVTGTPSEASANKADEAKSDGALVHDDVEYVNGHPVIRNGNAPYKKKTQDGPGLT